MEIIAWFRFFIELLFLFLFLCVRFPVRLFCVFVCTLLKTAGLAQRNYEDTQTSAVQEDVLEKELLEIQKVLLAMQVKVQMIIKNPISIDTRHFRKIKSKVTKTYAQRVDNIIPL